MAFAQEMADQAVVLDRINYSGLNKQAAWVPMAIGTAVVIVQKRVSKRYPHGKVSNRHQSEPSAGSNINNST